MPVSTGLVSSREAAFATRSTVAAITFGVEGRRLLRIKGR